MSHQISCATSILRAPPGKTIRESDSRRRVADWYSEWQRPLRRFIARRHSIPSRDLEDVAQEVFLRLMRYDRTELIEQPQAYLFKMAANVATEWATRSRNGSARETGWFADTVSDDSTNGEICQFEAEEEIGRALLALCPRHREILRLQFFEGLSHAQTAHRLGVTERMVKRALSKCYQRLRRKLLPP